MTASVRKKPCPYCTELLQAKSKGQWRKNLARHLANCAPYQRQTMDLMTIFLTEMVKCLLSLETAKADYMAAVTKKQDVGTLEHLYKES